MQDKTIYNDGDTGMLIKNKRHEFAGYDLRKKPSNKTLTKRYLPRHLLRIEWRLTKTAKCRDAGIKTLQDVIDRWYDLPDLFRDGVRKTLLPYEPESLRTLTNTNQPEPVERIIRNVLRWCARKEIDLGLRESDLRDLVKAEGLKGFRAALSPVRKHDKKHAQALVRNMRAALFTQQAMTVPDFAARYTELREKALAKGPVISREHAEARRILWANTSYSAPYAEPPLNVFVMSAKTHALFAA
jgi:hypothetical protein